MIDFEDGEEEGGGAGWLATFADLMSLLMCFFVLLLSFSEMDLAKYKQVAGSMRDAFGVQNEVRAKDIPKGTSIIAREFSPGRPETTLLNIVRQQTVQANLNTLDVQDRREGTADQENETGLTTTGEAAEIIEEQLQKMLEQTQMDAEKLIDQLEDEIEAGMIDIESEDRAITIRIRERGSFRSASASLQPEFVPVLSRIRTVLSDIEGQISVEGHTDSWPISTPLYKSNWSLSSSRALTVVEELRKFNELNEDRFLVIGHAANNPIAPDNLTEENRALNRRVEIIIRQNLGSELSAALDELRKAESDDAESSDVESGDVNDEVLGETATSEPINNSDAAEPAIR